MSSREDKGDNGQRNGREGLDGMRRRMEEVRFYIDSKVHCLAAHSLYQPFESVRVVRPK